MQSRVHALTAVLLSAAVVWAFYPADASAQSLLDRAKRAAKSTSIGTKVSAAGLEVEMIDAQWVDLDGQGLAEVAVGQFRFGVSGVEIANGKGLRLHTYLFNPTSQDLTVPVPDASLFRLVDTKGRTLELLSGPSMEGVEDSYEATVPALERVALKMLYTDLPDEPETALLKVGSLGMIPNIPVHTGAVAEVTTGGNNVWSGAQAAAPSSPWQQPSQPQQPAYQPPPPQQPAYQPPPTYPTPPPTYPTPPPTYPTPPSASAPTYQPPPTSQPAAPTAPTLGSGTNWISYMVTGAALVRQKDDGTVSCSVSNSGFMLRSTGGWTIDVTSAARDLGRHGATLQIAAPAMQGGTRAAGEGSLNLADLSGTSILTGSVTGSAEDSAGQSYSFSADFVCPLQ